MKLLPEYIGCNLLEVAVVGKGTQDGNPTADLLESVAGAVKGMRERGK